MDRAQPDWGGALGTVTLIVGPMFSGKTTELIRRLRVSLVARQRCCVVRPAIDDRWAGLHTHHSAAAQAGGLEPDEVAVFAGKTLREAVPPTGFDVVAVDEGQFFPDLAAECARLADRGVHVVVSALNGTFHQTPFPAVSELYPRCDKVIMLRAVCMACHAREAPFTVRVGADPSGGGVVDVGGADKYRAVCRACLVASHG